MSNHRGDSSRACRALPFHQRAPSILAIILGACALAACGTNGGEEPATNLDPTQASEIALSYAAEQGLFREAEPISTTTVKLTVEQARQQQTQLGFGDPFAALSPAPSEGSLVWVVTLVEEIILPSPGGEGTVQTRSVVAIVDDESGEVLWAERREPEP